MSHSDFVYTVTTLYMSLAGNTATRTPVLCSTHEKAEHIILTNAGGLEERLYSHAVIEKIKLDDMYCISTCSPANQTWFRWSEPQGRWLKMVKPPKAFVRTVNFAIG